jgi:putative sugar O-methyltransferase
MNNFKESELWLDINKELITENIDISTFREPCNKLNSRLATWDAYDKNSYRYFKYLLFNSIKRMPSEFLTIYRKIRNTNIGNPVCVTVDNTNVNIDYYFSVEELLFLNINSVNIKTIAEIGGGYGRLCHSMIKVHNDIEKYYLIDLPEMQSLSKKYLSEALSAKEYKKIVFIKAEDAGQIEDVDLFINIDSMAEMPLETNNNYLELINSKGRYFFSKNTIGKYSPESIGLEGYNEKTYNNAIKTGVCTQVIDIFNTKDLKDAQTKYLAAYKPSESWTIMKDTESSPYSYYHMVLYKNTAKG